jgi:hypothetical protein
MWAIFQLKAGHRDAVESCLSIHSVTTVVMRVMAPVRGTPVLALKVWLEDGISTSSMSGGSGDNWPGRLKGSGR